MVAQTKTKTKTAKSRLGTIMVLPDTFNKFDDLGNALKASNDKGLRDNYTLEEISKNVIKIYEKNKDKYAKYAKISNGKNKKMPSFSRNLFCQNILNNYTLVKKTVEHDSIINTHIAYCANIWSCPVCASLIQTRRSDEVQTAVDWATGNGYKTIMVTFTASHTAKYPLNEFGDKLQKAYEKMHNQLRHYRKKYEVGSIKAVEYTYSRKNGWHKHFHVIYFLRDNADIDNYFAKIKKSWQHQCYDNGLLESTNKAIADFDAHGCTLTEGATDAVAKYTNKSASEWTLADEMSKSVLKIGKSLNHITPFQMLANIGTDCNNRSHYIDKFIEYLLHTKGSHQMDWSCGLKKLCGIDDKSDDELCEEQKDTSYNIAALTVAHWHLLRSKHLRILYLKAAKDNGYQGIVDFFEEYGGKDCPDVIGKDDADILDAVAKDKDISAAEKNRYELLRVMLAAIADATPNTYVAHRYKKQYKDSPLTSDEKKSILIDKQRKKGNHIPITTADLINIKNRCKSTARLNRQKALKKYIPKYEQTTLI